MKHKLNLNEAGSKLFGIAAILLAVSMMLYGLGWMIERYAVRAAWLRSLAGFLGAAGAFLLLMVEALQDQAMDVGYRKQRSRRLPVEKGRYECQFLGSQAVHKEDCVCPVCGRELD